MNALSSPRGFLFRTLLIVCVSTLLLTASFVGMLGLLSGRTANVGSRLPYYLVVMGMAFVGTILLLEEHESDGQVVIVTASVIAIITLLTVTLSIEGVLFSFTHPDLVFVDQLVYYFITAALIGTGIGYWGVKHWREFAGQSTSRSRSGGL